MIIKYYFKDKLQQLDIRQACPGCGHGDKLVMHDQVKSYIHDKIVYWIGCTCGWKSPEADNPGMAAVKWEARAMLAQFAEVEK